MRMKFGALLAAAGLFCLAVPLVAHHSFSVEYDVNKPLTLKGVVTKVEWTKGIVNSITRADGKALFSGAGPGAPDNPPAR